MTLPLPEHMLVRNLAWLLVHTLWQGSLIALLVYLTLQHLASQRARLRYALLLCGFLAVVALPVITTLGLAQSHRSSALIVIGRAEGAMKQLPGSLWSLAALVWGLGALIMLGRLLWSWWQLAQARRHGTYLATDLQQLDLLHLAKRLGLNRPVWLLESPSDCVPMVVGWLRPTVLFPASAAARLTPEQVKTVLAHELAHIKRHDHLVNALQNLIGALLFFHPAVHWFARQLRLEREHCCDDAAVKTCDHDLLSYASALLELERGRSANAALVLGANGGSLLTRIERLTGEAKPARLSVGRYLVIILAACLFAGTGALAMTAHAAWSEPANAHQDGGQGLEEGQVVTFSIKFATGFDTEPDRGNPLLAPRAAGAPLSPTVTFKPNLFVGQAVVNEKTARFLNRVGGITQAELVLTLPASKDDDNLEGDAFRIPLTLPAGTP